MEQFRLPKIPMPELEPQSIQAVLQEAEESLRTVQSASAVQEHVPEHAGDNNQTDGGWHDICDYR